MAARRYKRKSKVYSTRRTNTVKNNWVFNFGRIANDGAALLIFRNTTPGANFREKRIIIMPRGPLKFTYSGGTNYKSFDVKRTSKLLNSLRKYKNQLT